MQDVPKSVKVLNKDISGNVKSKEAVHIFSEIWNIRLLKLPNDC